MSFKNHTKELKISKTQGYRVKALIQFSEQVTSWWIYLSLQLSINSNNEAKMKGN